MKRAGIVGCSNGQKKTAEPKLLQLEQTLLDLGFQIEWSSCIYEKENIFSGSAKERARALMKCYESDEIEEIFDISGGDVANGILPYLDYDRIKNSSKTYWGYSDLTTILNAIYAKTGKSSVLYTVKNLTGAFGEEQRKDFWRTLQLGMPDLYAIDCQFLQGSQMEGIVIGGNIRCFLKLAGTEYMPDMRGKILLLEAYSGSVGKMETYLCQLQQLGAFSQIAGILLGTFTQMEEEDAVPTIEMLVRRVAGDRLPIAVTRQIGHGADAKAIQIGQKITIKHKKMGE